MSNDTPKKSRNRSPNHPSLDLAEAVSRTKLLHEKYGTHPVPIKNATETMGYTSMNSSALQCVAALTYYGLVESSGSKDERKLTITKEGDRIVRKAPDRKELLKTAARKPPIHKEVLDKFPEGLPHDDILSRWLVWEKDGGRFNEDAVSAFITRLRKTLAYSEIDLSDSIDDTESPETPDQERIPKVGDYVQRTSQGVDRFQEPRQVTKVSDNGEWAFVEGNPTGFSMTELSVVEPSVNSNSRSSLKVPPVNPDYQQPRSKGPTISFPLSGDNTFELRLQHRISRKDFDRLKKLIDLSEDSLVEEGDE